MRHRVVPALILAFAAACAPQPTAPAASRQDAVLRRRGIHR